MSQIALNSAIAQVASSGDHVSKPPVLKRLVHESETLRSLWCGISILSAHTQQVAACNALHELESG